MPTCRSNRRGNFYFDEYARQYRQLADPYYVYTVCAGLYIFRPPIFYVCPIPFDSSRFTPILHPINLIELIDGAFNSPTRENKRSRAFMRARD